MITDTSTYITTSSSEPYHKCPLPSAGDWVSYVTFKKGAAATDSLFLTSKGTAMGVASTVKFLGVESDLEAYVEKLKSGAPIEATAELRALADRAISRIAKLGPPQLEDAERLAVGAADLFD